MENFNLVIPTNIGLEAVVKRELLDLSYENITVDNGKVVLNGNLQDMAKLNLHIRAGERVLIEIASFKALTFEELFDRVYEIDWGYFLAEDSNFIVQGRSKNSKLFSVSDIQRISEKAIVEKLKEKYKVSWFEKSGARYKLEVQLNKDIATIYLDTSGDGLHKRGYRARNYKAPISETLAAAMVLLSYWNSSRILADPFCGSGTIPIEAAMIGRKIAPGINRNFDFEGFSFVDPSILKELKKEAYSMMDYDLELNILASDISYRAIEVAKANAELLGLEEEIQFFQKDISSLSLPDEYGVIITNPPYGERLGEVSDVEALEKELGSLYRSIPTWSLYAITSHDDFERNFGAAASRNRKLYNGRIKTYYYQYYGPAPKGGKNGS